MGQMQAVESVVSALIKQSSRLPGELYRPLTWDRGKELAGHLLTLGFPGSAAQTKTPTGRAKDIVGTTRLALSGRANGYLTKFRKGFRLPIRSYSRRGTEIF